VTGKVAVMIRQADIRTELVSVLGSSALLGARQKRRPAEWQTLSGRPFALIFDDQVHTQRRSPSQSPDPKAPHMRGHRQ
jgi:hypothetical protein